MGAQFNQLILDVADIPRSVDFYVGLLNLELCGMSVVDGHELAMLNANGLRVLLVQQDDVLPHYADRSPGVVMSFEVLNINHTLAKANAAGTTFLRGIERSSTGESTVLLADPDGYPVLLSGRGEMVH